MKKQQLKTRETKTEGAEIRRMKKWTAGAVP